MLFCLVMVGDYKINWQEKLPGNKVAAIYDQEQVPKKICAASIEEQRHSTENHIIYIYIKVNDLFANSISIPFELSV